ncbi:MAG: hypothetical protein KAH84_09940 [Thiomargarita sp.]|nr:hypothetical protein [Thiomargarita sp.]
MTTLNNATLDLFLYDIREGLGQSQEDINKNRERFKQKIPGINHDKFDYQDNEYFEPEYLELLPVSRTIDFVTATEKGYYFPVRLNDTYGLLIECELLEDQQIKNLVWLQNLQQTILSKLNRQTATMGETWLFSAKISYSSDKCYLKLVKRCCASLIPNYENVQIEYNRFLDGHIFECRATNQQLHIIIIFYQLKETEEKLTELYPDFIRLLAYHHKISWAYHQSRQLKQQLKNEAKKTEDCRTELSIYMHQRFSVDKFQQTLQKTWQILSNYSMVLSDLSCQIRTIETNHSNYNKRLNMIEDNIEQKLACLTQFSFQTQHKYLIQVQTDYANLSPELNSLESMIGYIRASISIEEAKRERSFQNMVAVWGIGLAIGAIIASVSGQFPIEAIAKSDFGLYLKNWLYIPETWFPVSISIILSLSVAFTAGIFTKLLIAIKNR